MKYKRWKALRKACAALAVACLLGMSACSGIKAVNGAWWDCTPDAATVCPDGSGSGSGTTG